MRSTECSPMTTLAMMCGLIAGLALVALQLRHMGWKATLLDREVREDLRQPLDRNDKCLLAISAVAFSLCILFLVLGYS